MPDYEVHRDYIEFDCKCTLQDYSNLFNDIDSSVSIEKTDYESDIIEGNTNIEKMDYNLDIDSVLNLDKNNSFFAIDGKTSIDKINHSLDIDSNCIYDDENKQGYDLLGKSSIKYDIKDLNMYCYVTLHEKELSSTDLLSGIVRLETEEFGHSSFDATLNINKYIQRNDMIAKASINYEEFNSDDIIGNLYLDSDKTESDILYGSISVVDYYLDKKSELNCHVFLDSINIEAPYAELDGHTKIRYDKYTNERLVGKVTLIKSEFSEPILDGTVNMDKENVSTDIMEGSVKLAPYDKEHFFPASIVIPKFSSRTFFNGFIRTVLPSNYTIISRINVDNPSITLLDANVTLDKDILNQDILESTVTMQDYEKQYLEGSVNLKSFNTVREIDCHVNLISKTLADFDGVINIEKYPDPVYYYDNNILGTVTLGDRNKIDIDASISIIPVEIYSKDIECKVHLIPTIIPKKYRVGIVVDPIWDYEPFVFKSSLITFLDKFHHKNPIDLLYGGNSRSDWDIRHLGEVYDVNLIDLQCRFERGNNSLNRIMLNKVYNKLFEKPLDRLFIFSYKPGTSGYSPITPLIIKCIQNHVSAVVISSDGEYYELNKLNNFNCIETNYNTSLIY